MIDYHNARWKPEAKSSFMKIRPVGAKLFHADGRTDMTKLIVPFRNFANTPVTIKYRAFVSVFLDSTASDWPTKWDDVAQIYFAFEIDERYPLDATIYLLL